MKTNTIGLRAVVCSLLVIGLASVVYARPKNQSHYKEIGSRGQKVLLKKRVGIPSRQQRGFNFQSRSLSSLNTTQGFNLSYFERPGFVKNGARVREIFDSFKAEGFNSVRIPIKWDSQTERMSPYNISSGIWGDIEWTINEARKRGFTITINVHGYDELMANPTEERARFLRMWEQIANRFKNQGSDLRYEILNEPKGEFNTNTALLNEIHREALVLIRKTNPTRVVMVQPARWGSINKLNELDLPVDSNLAVQVHYYEPFTFSHSGAEWVSPIPSCNASWAGTDIQKREVNLKLDQAVSWSTTNKVPVILGEFGAYKKCTKVADRARWTSHVRKGVEARGIGWYVWESDLGFGMYNSSTNQWVPEILNALRYW